jgi:aarF domain-containing kinase
MLKSSFTSLFAKPLAAGTGWTCARCRSQLPTPNYQFSAAAFSRQYGGTPRSFPRQKPKARPRRRAAVILAAAGGGAAAMLLSVGDDVKNTYEAMERSGRVVSALVLCVNE